MQFTPYIYYALFLLWANLAFGQRIYLDVKAEPNGSKVSAAIPDYEKIHDTETDMLSELGKIQLKMQKMGYLQNKLDTLIKTDTLYTASFIPGHRIERIILHYHGTLHELFSNNKEWATINETITLPFEDLENLMQQVTNYYAGNSQPFAEVLLEAIEIEGTELRANLTVSETYTRTIDEIVINGYPEFPAGFKKHALGIAVGEPFSKKNVDLSSVAVRNIPFVSETKPPEVLFTKDSTSIYYFFEKKRSSSFDGLVGFSNDRENDKLIFNGYLFLSLENIFNRGESISLKWQNNGNDRKEIDLRARLPFVFQSGFSPEFSFNLYQQDSTFNNINFNFDLYYKLRRRSELAALFHYTKSNDLLQESADSSLSSFKTRALGLAFFTSEKEGSLPDWHNYELNSKVFWANRSTEDGTEKQYRIELLANKIWTFNPKNSLFTQWQGKFLASDTYFYNELFRIGGIKTLRGFGEESLLTNLYGILNTEYRYKTSTSSFFHSITDIGYLENEILNENTKILSLGLGYSFLTKIGRIHLAYALARTDKIDFDFNNSNLHLNIINYF